MNLNDSVYSLDLGTTKFCLMALNKGANGSLSLRNISVKAHGMHGGMVADFKGCKAALAELFKKAEESWSTEIQKIAVGISGSHLKSELVWVNKPIVKNQVRNETLAALEDSLNAHWEAKEGELIYKKPLYYQIDEREITENPLHFSGHTLKGYYFCVLSDPYYLNDIQRIIHGIGRYRLNFYPESIASLYVSCLPKDFLKGFAFLDIGGGSTDGIVYSSENPKYIFTVNAGSRRLNECLSQAYGLNDEKSELVKRHFGLGLSDPLEITDDISSITLTHDQIKKTLVPCLYDWAEELRNHLLPFRSQIPGGIILSGGGSGLRNLGEFMEQILGVKVSFRSPALDLRDFSLGNLDQDEFRNLSPSFATSLGLIKLELLRRLAYTTKTVGSYRHHKLSSLFDWFRQEY